MIINNLFVGITLSAKMLYVPHLSTSPLKNSHCQKRHQNKIGICEFCFSMQSNKLYAALRNHLIDNYDLLTTKQVEKVDLTSVPNNIARLEAFGDIENELQVLNYFNICKANKKRTFALWTKNPWIIKSAMDQYLIAKPKNLIIVYSMQQLDINPAHLQRLANTIIKKFPFIDKVFTVYTAAYAVENKIHINCGNKQCNSCRLCYKKNKTVFVNEILKKDFKKFEKLGGKIYVR